MSNRFEILDACQEIGERKALIAVLIDRVSGTVVEYTEFPGFTFETLDVGKRTEGNITSYAPTSEWRSVTHHAPGVAEIHMHRPVGSELDLQPGEALEEHETGEHVLVEFPTLCATEVTGLMPPPEEFDQKLEEIGVRIDMNLVA